MTIDLASLGRELKKPVEQIQSAIDLLDEGNTIPFITRFRKDQTGGLNEEQLLVIKQSVARLRAISERRSFIRKSIESQERLTDQISKSLDNAQSSRELEDIYLPFKPKKQTLATVARQNGLEPLANDIFEGREPEKDLATRATDFVRVDKQLNSVDEVIAGVGHILAEKFSDNVDLRVKLRKLIKQNGKFVTQLIPLQPEATVTEQKQESQETKDDEAAEKTTASDSETPAADGSPVESTPTIEQDSTAAENTSTEPSEPTTSEAGAEETPAEAQATSDTQAATTVESKLESDSSSETQSNQETSETDAETATATDSTDSENGAVEGSAEQKPVAKKKKRKKSKKKTAPDPYAEFADFSQSVGKMPYHKTLAINRGEKGGRLKVKIQFDESEFLKEACKTLVPENHPFSDFMESCARDSMTRLVIPSVEREIRREVTEAAEKHAVLVFAKNLKNLLLQSPVREFRVLAIDPGYKRGCSVAVVDRGGQVLANSHIFVVGNEQRKTESKEKLANLIQEHSVALIAIGNGTACRETEQLVSDLITEQLKDKNVQYAMVNEAGASVYSTSEVGREELPESSPAIRSAVSIGRRLIDPLSELVKISPANIGVGLYQHDIKAKHLSETLDDVVQFCVNRVGVDVNTASPSLLRYVSGLNQLTARRLYEYRQENGAFKNREQLKQVAGFGDATFVQSAGFLRIRDGDQPLDTTGVHPENYDVAQKVLDSAKGKVDELFPIAENTVKETPQTEAATTEAAVAESTSTESPTPTAASPAPQGADASASDASAEVPSESPTSDSATEADLAPAAQPTESDATDSAETATADVSPTAPVAAPEKQPESKERPKLTDQQKSRRRELVDAIRKLDINKLSKEFEIGEMLLRDIINAICKPEFDPRRGLNRPVFRSGIIKIDDLKKDLCLEAQVVNVVDFGVFVDIGLGTSCLVHVSQLANYFIRDPHRFFAVGDVMKVWVTEVDAAKRRVTLTAIKPESLRQPRGGKSGGGRSGGRKTGGAKQGKFSRRKPTERRKPKRPKPVKPITDDMLTGAEPMRSFSDLAQFFDKQTGSEKGKDKS